MSRLGKILFVCSGIMMACFVIVRVILGWVPFCWVALGFSVALALAGFWFDRLFFNEFFSMKTTRQGMSMGTMIVLVITMLTAVNFLGVRRYTTWDLSMGKVNSLSDQSVKLIKDLKEDLKVIYFYKDGAERVEDNKRAFSELMRKYQDVSPRVQLEFVEIIQHPEIAEKYEIKKGTQSVILEYQGRKNLIDKIDEQEITNALVKVSRDKDKIVYVVNGHGELPLDQAPDGMSMSVLKTWLAGNRYTVKPLNLSETPVPKDADVVVVAGPTQQFLDLDVKALEAYLREGGSVLLALEPRSKHDLDPILKNVGLRLSNTVVLSVMDLPGVGRAVDPRATAATVFSTTHNITKPFSKGQAVVFRQPQAIEHETATPSGISLEDIVKSNENSVAFEDLQFTKDKGKGPFALAVAAKGKYPGAAEGKEFNMVVIGDRDIVSDVAIYQNLNRDLIMNTLAGLSKDENLISISPKEVSRTQMDLTDIQMKMFVFVFLLPLPIALFSLSGMVWYRRRYS